VTSKNDYVTAFFGGLKLLEQEERRSSTPVTAKPASIFRPFFWSGWTPATMAEAELNPTVFHRRLARLVNDWKAGANAPRDQTALRPLVANPANSSMRARLSGWT